MAGVHVSSDLLSEVLSPPSATEGLAYGENAHEITFPFAQFSSSGLNLVASPELRCGPPGGPQGWPDASA